MMAPVGWTFAVVVSTCRVAMETSLLCLDCTRPAANFVGTRSQDNLLMTSLHYQDCCSTIIVPRLIYTKWSSNLPDWLRENSLTNNNNNNNNIVIITIAIIIIIGMVAV